MKLPQYLTLAVVATIAWAAQAADLTSSTEELVGFDKRRDRRATPSAEQQEGREKLRRTLRDAKVEFDARLGSPKWIRAERENLTGRRGQGKAVAAQAQAAARFENDPDMPVKAFIEEHRTLFGHGPEELDRSIKARDYVNEHSRVRTTVWHQRVDSIPVYEGIFATHVNERGELIDISSQFVPDSNRAANRGTPNRAAQVRSPRNSARRALEIAVSTIGETAEDYTSLTSRPEGAEQAQSFTIKPLPGQATARLVWFALDRDTMRLAWQVELNRRQFAERFRVLVDVQNGEVLLWRKLTVDIGAVTYRVYTNDSPTPMRPGWPTPNSARPPVVPQSLVTIAALSTNASPIGWINDGEVLLRGNNVDAAPDRDFDNRPDLPRVTATLDENGHRTFDYPVIPALPPTNYTAGASVQLFYWCNFAHDRLYDIGFTEAKGNYQKDNFGRGGLGNDPVVAEAQDGSGVNNANFTPTVDGQPGRMQMFIFDGPNPHHDADLDAEVILHEYVHGMSDRRVGHGVQISQLQTWGMAEGWSDFFAEAMLTRFEHDLDANYPMGGYASHLFGGLRESYYYGIRRYPYTTSTNINPLMFSDIDPQQAFVYPEIPRNPTVSGIVNGVHRIGEVWCTMLWEVRAALLRSMNLTPETYPAANDFVMRIVGDGMDFTPPNPTFTQARDGILTAERQITGGTNAHLIWKAFAKRGLGYSAISTDSGTTTGIVSAYDVPPAPTLVVTPDVLTFSGVVGSNFTPHTAEFIVRNESDAGLLFSVSSAMPFPFTPLNGVVPARSSVPVTVFSEGMGALPIGEHAFTITFSNSANTSAVTRTVAVLVSSPPDFLVVEPESTFLMAGPLGGPFIPDSHVYTLQAGAPLVWSVSNIPPWLTLSQTDGSLGAGQVTNLTASLNANAAAFEGGVYSRVISFINHNSGAKEDRLVTVRVATDDYLTEDFSTHPFDLENSTLTLTPYSTGYAACLTMATNFQTDPSTGTTVSNLGDDAYHAITLTNGHAVKLFGQSFGVLWIGANGNVTPNPGGNTNFFFPGLAEYFSAIRVAPLYVDLNPQQGGRISWQQFSNRLVVTYENVPEFGKLDVNSFQTELFFDGTIQITWLNVETDAAVVGVSGGAGIPADFAPSDLSAFAGCTLSARLTMPLAAREGDGVVTGTILLSGIATTNLSVTLNANSPDVQVPASVVIPAGTASISFPITVVDDSLLDGSQSASIVATLPDRPSASASIVVHDNESARIVVALPVEVTEGSGVLPNEAFIFLSADADRDVTVNLVSSNSARISVPSTVVVPAGSRVAFFSINVLDDVTLNGRYEDVTIAASVQHWPFDRDVIAVRDNDPYELRINAVPQVVENGATTILGGLVSLPAVAVFDVTVSLNSDQPSVLFPGPSVTIPAGTQSNSFLLFVVNNATTNSFNSARIVASSAGFLSATGSVLVIDDERPTAPIGPSPTNNARFVPSQVTLTWSVVPAPQPGTVLYSVYLSTNEVLDSSTLVGITTNLFFAPTVLLDTGKKYYWRVVARREPFSASSAVWSFEVAPANHFTIEAVPSPRTVGQPFEVLVTARDKHDSVAATYQGNVTLTNFAPVKPSTRIVVTEFDLGNAGRVEFQNVSAEPVSIGGWQMSFYDSQNWPAPRMTFSVPDPTTVQPGQIFRIAASPPQFAPGAFPNFLLGTALFWNTNPTNNPIAVLVRDSSGEIADFVCAVDAFPQQITSPVSIPLNEWSGAPIPLNTTIGASYQRIGNRDANNVSDWTYQPVGISLTNQNIRFPFTNYVYASMVTSTFSNFVGGVSTGTVTVFDEAWQMYLGARDGEGRSGISPRFDVLAFGDISLRAVAPLAVVVEEPFVVSIAITNRGSAPASQVVLSNVLSAGVLFVGAGSSQGTCSLIGSAVVCQLGGMSGDSSASVSLTLRATAPVAITNEVTISRGEADAYAANNRVTTFTKAAFPQIMIADGSLLEPTIVPGAMSFNVRLAVSNAAPVSVQFATSDAMAVGGLDYVPTNGWLHFPSGVTNQVVSVTVLPDLFSESNETFAVTLFNASNAQISDSVANGTINDSDGNPTLNVADVVLTEGAGTNVATFSLNLSAASGKVIGVAYATADGTAVAGFDYLLTYGFMVFPPGVTNRTVVVPLINHDVYKPSRSFALTLATPIHTTLARGQAICTIVDKDTNRLDHLAFETVPAKAFQKLPFTVTGTGRDAVGGLVTSFNGPVHLLATENEVVRSVASNGPPWEFPLGTGFHDSRLQVIYHAAELGIGHLTSLALDVTNTPGLTLSNFTIRTRPFTSFFPQIRWENEGWTTNFQADVTIVSTGWVTFAFQTPRRVDGMTNLLVDFSFNNSSYGAEGMCRSTITSGLRSLGLRTDGAFGNPLAWSNATPSPSVFNRIPNTRFTIGTPLPVTPASIASVNGVFTGAISLDGSGSNVTLRAVDDAGHSAIYSGFLVVSDGDGDGMPDWWEMANNLDRIDTSDGLVDSDGDGFTNYQEYLAGTDPHGASSFVKILELRRPESDLVQLLINSVAGRNYQIETSTNLPVAWSPVAVPLPGTGGVLELIHRPSPNDRVRFYRVRVSP